MTESEPRVAVLWCDGACRHAFGEGEGPSGYGFVLTDEMGSTLLVGKGRIGLATNNVAEYQSLLAGLRAAADLGVRDLVVRMDSEFVITQMRGENRVRKAHLKPLHQRALELCEPFDDVRFEHVRREQNRAADRLANEALDEP